MLEIAFIVRDSAMPTCPKSLFNFTECVRGNGSPEVTGKFVAKHRLSTWCPQLTPDPLLGVQGEIALLYCRRSSMDSVCWKSSHSAASLAGYRRLEGCSLTPSPAHCRHSLRGASLQHGHRQNLSWLDSFSRRTPALLDRRMTPSPVLGSVALERKRGGCVGWFVLAAQWAF